MRPAGPRGLEGPIPPKEDSSSSEKVHLDSKRSEKETPGVKRWRFAQEKFPTNQSWRPTG
jgi:hypothetical protein